MNYVNKALTEPDSVGMKQVCSLIYNPKISSWEMLVVEMASDAVHCGFSTEERSMRVEY